MQSFHPSSLYKITVVILAAIEGWVEAEKCIERRFEIIKNGILFSFLDCS